MICTLFENQYHFGLAALTNSLYHQGYRGSIFAGYRGALPEWTSAAKENESLKWPGARSFDVEDGLQLHFLPLETDYHLTNYKPDFMLRLWEGPAKEATEMFFFDPDIVINAKWDLFRKWVDCGVALCEDVNSPISSHHPRRIAWRQYFGAKGFSLQFKDSIYVNGGFVGVRKKDQSFLKAWKDIQEAMAFQIGGLNRSAIPFEIKGDRISQDDQSLFSPFGRTDQDALNATVEAWEGDVSLVGKEGMGFKNGTSLMFHALGRPKPWFRKPLAQTLKGRPPRIVDLEYWKNSVGPIKAHSNRLIILRKVSNSVSSAIGRFYRGR